MVLVNLVNHSTYEKFDNDNRHPFLRVLFIYFSLVSKPNKTMSFYYANPAINTYLYLTFCVIGPNSKISNNERAYPRRETMVVSTMD